MGYRSEVAVVVPHDAPEMKIFGFMSGPYVFAGDGNKDHDQYIGYKAFYGDWLKFYDGYDYVDELVEYMRSLDADGRESDYGFMRVGEELEDVDYRGRLVYEAVFNIELVHRINFGPDVLDGFTF